MDAEENAKELPPEKLEILKEKLRKASAQFAKEEVNILPLGTYVFEVRDYALRTNSKHIEELKVWLACRRTDQAGESMTTQDQFPLDERARGHYRLGEFLRSIGIKADEEGQAVFGDEEFDLVGTAGFLEVTKGKGKYTDYIYLSPRPRGSIHLPDIAELKY